MKFLNSIVNSCNTQLSLFLLSALILSSTLLQGQTGSVSPYSRYGLGELKNQGLSHHRATGGLANAWDDQQHINLVNSATLAFDTTTIFEVGFDVEWVNISSNAATTQATSGTFGYFALAFPVIKNKWSSTFGVQPISSTGYNVTVNDFREDIGTVKFIYEGKGGFNKFFFNNGIKILPNLSIGLSASYLFGTIENIKSVEFPTNEDYFNSRYIDGLTANDFQFDGSIYYFKSLARGRKISFGAVASIPTSLRARQNVYWYNYTKSVFGIEITKDSVSTNSNENGEINMPIYYRFGAMYSVDDTWRIGADFNYINWETFKKFDVKDSLSNSYSMHLGGEYAWEKIRLMAGLQYSKTFLDLREQQLDDYSFTFGISLVKLFSIRPPVFINLAFEVGQKGTEDANLIKEQYTRFTFGLSISDIWFRKPKYD